MKASQDLDQSRLSRPVLSEQTCDPARIEIQIHSLQHHLTRERFPDIPQLENWCIREGGDRPRTEVIKCHDVTGADRRPSFRLSTALETELGSSVRNCCRRAAS